MDKKPSKEAVEITYEFIMPALMEKMYEERQRFRLEVDTSIERLQREKKRLEQLIAQAEVVEIKFTAPGPITVRMTTDRANRTRALSWAHRATGGEFICLKKSRS